MRYFLTGATGFIGGHVARQLVSEGHEVVALVRTPEKAAALAALGVALHKGDITDKESMRAPMTGVDGVFHMAAWYEVGVPDSSMAERINVQGTRNVLELMRELDIPKGVYTSTLAVFSDTQGKVVDESYYHKPADGKWNSEYDRTKWLAHYEVAVPMMQAGLPLVIVQPGLVYGPGDESVAAMTLRSYLLRRLPISPQGTAFAWAHVADVTRAHILTMEKGQVGESYIIAGPVHTLMDALAIAERITGIPGPRLHPPLSLIRATAALTALVEKVVPLPMLYRAETLRSTAATYIASNAKAKRELGYEPRSLEEGLRETLAYEMKHLGLRSA